MTTIDHEMWDYVQASDLPLVLTRLSDFTVQEATAAFFEQVAIDPKELLGESVFNLMEPDERPRAQEALQALADGTINFYRTYRSLSLERTKRRGACVWSHAIDFGERRFALSQFRTTEPADDSPLFESLGYDPAKFVIGIIDERGVVASVSNDVKDVLGFADTELIGRPLLSREQQALWTSLQTFTRAHGGCSISLPYLPPIHLRMGGTFRCLLVALATSSSFCFIISLRHEIRNEEPPGLSAQLAHHLMNIAKEVQASGVLGGLGRVPDPERFPQLNTLNARQWDVLTRLLRGDRVAAIAEQMHLSPSAVRNYLSELFQKFSVHSQSELLMLLHS